MHKHNINNYHIYTKKKTTVGDGVHSRVSRNKHSTKKKYRGQGK